MYKPTILHCRKSTVKIIIITTILLFILIGCQSLFRSAGLTDEEAAIQTAQLQDALADAAMGAVANIQTGLEEGHDLKTIAVKTSSTFIWKIITAASATVGVILNGLLAKWLRTEKKITQAIITGVEDAHASDVKASIKRNATAAGIEPKLATRVKALT